ncbi:MULTISPECIES: biotin-independent malonate decarboxylase subunit gamma [Bradyrhizobium]|uniref:Malonate decarboxylase gamma subunit n=1 Tax=Bradyrhizobium diazoefficiens (strain JCM 10833 / BCRC 13528 / IAM 13628 / NBRC 14792 / USDA 110) TaxID=224911 RepID=Q89UY5_BRADU|nr:biotin-independent malonate decarboxylase subunit gamma [Bradyrhizobium diazoefficiens]MBP1059960.1 malonate decarboxylase gamma subunit [Bradyrhizobium japonicum]AND86949.1 malonate decarboxylase subunit gamma [Bradyrhizobium diazoefficiens USDA 110]AWO88427.1 biotin-independent malonate decarboxylase subunit gamma [Bradyrhizobium diazoefficiens]PDT59418.1 biotin-independent malonate decarboxylase subunit gamma [Bradyrhizobium diazoefficiens]QBP20211.1 biotin-independent malonate decarboxy
MTPDDILAGLFPNGRKIETTGAMIAGQATLPDGGPIHVLGITQGQPLGVDEAIALAGRVIEIIKSNDRAPILVLVDSASQRMSKRDELLGLSEYLSHLAKALLLAEAEGHRTVGLLYGGSAAGAFIATALATGTLVALPGAHPAVMDLPSMARVTKLPIEVLKAKAEATPVFAPGLDNMVRTGGIHVVWDETAPLAPQLAAVLAQPAGRDERSRLGAERGGRRKAAEIADRVVALAAISQQGAQHG